MIVTAPHEIAFGGQAQRSPAEDPRAVKSDEALAAAAQRGDRRSFDALVERYGDRVLRFVLARVRDRHDAEEATQEAFLRAWGALARYDARWRFSTWLFTIAHREAVTVVRRRRGAEEAGPRAAREAAEGEVAGAPASGVWCEAARALGRTEYEAVWLCYVEECTPREIALILGRTSIAVRVMLHRARERLREVISATEAEEVRGGAR